MNRSILSISATLLIATSFVAPAQKLGRGSPSVPQPPPSQSAAPARSDAMQRSGVPPAGSKFPQSGRVVAATLKASRVRDKGVCPIPVEFVGSIRTDGAATVRYQFVHSSGVREGPVQTMTFRDAGVQSVSHRWAVSASGRYEGWAAIRVISPNAFESSHETGKFTVLCIGQADSVINEQPQTPTLQPATTDNVIAGQPANLKPAPADQPLPPGVTITGGPRPPQLPPGGRFRVVLNGFTVNSESNDDVLAGDGHGDEVYFVADSWMVDPSGTDNRLRRVQTNTIGDANQGYIRGGHKSDSGGFGTGDKFPTDPPWRRSVPITTRLHGAPPIVLWEGSLYRGRSLVAILPSVWEVDGSGDIFNPDGASPSERSCNEQLLRWFEDAKREYMHAFTDRRRGVLFGPILLRLAGKPGTRPIGYTEAEPAPAEEVTSNALVNFDHLPMQALVLTYDSAMHALTEAPLGVRGVFEIRYRDAHDHGDYSLFLQVEKLD